MDSIFKWDEVKEDAKDEIEHHSSSTSSTFVTVSGRCNDAFVCEEEEVDESNAMIISCGREGPAEEDSLMAESAAPYLPFLSVATSADPTSTTMMTTARLSNAEASLHALLLREVRLRDAGQTVTASTFFCLDNKGFSSHLRKHMVRWLMKFQQQLELTSLSVATALNILYRYVASNDVPLAKLDLATLTAMWVGTKIHEEDDLALDDLCYFLQRRHTKEDMIECERLMVKSIHYSLVCSTALEIAHQTMDVCSAVQRDAIGVFVAIILDTCLLDTCLATDHSAAIKGVASVFAALDYAGFDNEGLVAALKCVHFPGDSKKLMHCTSLFRDVLTRTCGPGRSDSPVSVLFEPH